MRGHTPHHCSSASEPAHNSCHNNTTTNQALHKQQFQKVPAKDASPYTRAYGPVHHSSHSRSKQEVGYFSFLHWVGWRLLQQTTMFVRFLRQQRTTAHLAPRLRSVFLTPHAPTACCQRPMLEVSSRTLLRHSHDIVFNRRSTFSTTTPPVPPTPTSNNKHEPANAPAASVDSSLSSGNSAQGDDCLLYTSPSPRDRG